MTTRTLDGTEIDDSELEVFLKNPKEFDDVLQKKRSEQRAALNAEIDEAHRKIRKLELVDEEKKIEQQAEEAKKNEEFFMVFKKCGAPELRKLITESHIAAVLFLFIAEEMDRANALVASYSALSARLKFSKASISRAVKLLEEKKFIKRFKSSGTNVFCANPEFIWNSWSTGKKYALFNNAKVLISKDEQDVAVVKKYNVVIEKKKAA